MEEGARAYIERINVRGNTRTRDYVIRREFDIGEGDAYNRALIDRAERRLKNLDYFKTVKITNEPGSAPDRVVINVNVEEKSTGEFSVSGGFSTAEGFIGEVSVAERNLMGRGQFAKATLTYGQYTRGVDLVLRRAVSARLPDGRRRRRVLEAGVGKLVFVVRYEYRRREFRLGFALTEELAFQPRYSIYRQEITLPAYLNDCVLSPNALVNGGGGVTPASEALSNWERHWRLLRQRRDLVAGPHCAGQWRYADLAGRLYVYLQRA